MKPPRALADALEEQARENSETIGLGVDIAPVAPFRERAPVGETAFDRLVFTDDERAYCRTQADPAQHLAARFAAKEAAVKAASGRVEIAVPQVEITRDARTGRPGLRFVSRRGEPAPAANGWKWQVSLSHSTEHALACVIAHFSPDKTNESHDRSENTGNESA